jgi:hypothetical protein
MKLMTPARTVRFLGAYLLEVAVAALAPKVLESPYEAIPQHSSVSRAMQIEDLVTSATALILGYAIYSRWPHRSARWIWLTGVAWFAQHAIRRLLAGQPGTTYSSVLDSTPGPQYVADWALYVLPSLRTIFYSVGACLRGKSG